MAEHPFVTSMTIMPLEGRGKIERKQKEERWTISWMMVYGELDQ